MLFNKKKWLFKRKLCDSIGKSKDLWKALKSLGLPNKTSSCKVSDLKINKTVKLDDNSVLERFKNYYSTLAEILVNMLPKAPNKYPSNTAVKYYEDMIQGSHSNLESVSAKLFIAILK